MLDNVINKLPKWVWKEIDKIDVVLSIEDKFTSIEEYIN